MSSGLCPPEGLASGVICPALSYCSTEWETSAAAVCATTCTNRFAVSCERTRIVPMLRTHAKQSRVSESWHFAECGGTQLRNF